MTGTIPSPQALGAAALIAMLAAGTAHGGWLEREEDTARALFAEEKFRAAAARFQDDYRRGVALYRAQRYQEAADAFERVARPEVDVDARYNLGNARFQLGDYQGAVTAYEDVLADEPEHEDAQYNLMLARAMLAYAPEQTPEEEEELEEEEEEESDEEQESEESSSDESDSDSEGESGEASASEEDEGEQGGETQTGSSGETDTEESGGGSGEPTEEEFGEQTSDADGGGGVEQEQDYWGEEDTPEDEGSGQESAEDAQEFTGQEEGEQGGEGVFDRLAQFFRDPWEEAPEEGGETGENGDQPDEGEDEALGDDDRAAENEAASRAAEEFDQRGPAPDEDAADDESTVTGFNDAAASGFGGVIPWEWVVEQWLERLDSDPGHLLRQQFAAEERRAEAARGGPILESRPW